MGDDRELVNIIIPHWCLGKIFCKTGEFPLAKNTELNVDHLGEKNI